MALVNKEDLQAEVKKAHEVAGEVRYEIGRRSGREASAYEVVAAILKRVVSLIATAPEVDPVHAAGACYCVECKHKYWKDFDAYCPHKVGPCRPDFFCGYGEKEEKHGK